MASTTVRAVPLVRREIMLYVKIVLGLLIFSLLFSLPLFFDFVKGLPEPSVIQYGDEVDPYVWGSYEQAFKNMLFLFTGPVFLVALLRSLFSYFITKDEQKRRTITNVGLAAMVAIYWILTWTGGF